MRNRILGAMIVDQKHININSLAIGRFDCDSKNVIFNLVLLIGIFRSSHDNALLWMPQDLTDDKSTLVQVMAWCRQATSPYLSQCWRSSLSPYGIDRPQWVNSLATGGFGSTFESAVSELILQNKFMSISCEIALRWMPQKICYICYSWIYKW